MSAPTFITWVDGAIRRRIGLYKWSFIVMWRILSGRWYVFRDAPDWFVRECAELEPKASDTDVVIEIMRQAAIEWRVRLMRRKD